MIEGQLDINTPCDSEGRLLRGNIEIGTAEDQQMGLVDMIQFLKENNCPMNKMVEVGTWAGASALAFAKGFNEVICIDHWNGCEGFYHIYDICKRNTACEPKIKLLRAYSKNAAYNVQDESLDFVYIDGDHREECVREDIQLWFPKVRKGGAIAGHDYGRTDRPGGFNFEGLTRAVNETVGKPDKTFRDTSWLVLKK